ncbi:MAG: hypothetical protein IJZ47_06475 [Oscillospiraceae bacterium]|nr:hypothetical protein [Oscillospiraceae bacterium]
MNKTSLTFSNKTCYVALAKNKNPVYTLRVGKSGEDFTKVERKSTKNNKNDLTAFPQHNWENIFYLRKMPPEEGGTPDHGTADWGVG